MILGTPDAVCPHGVDITQVNGTVVHNQSSDPTLVSKWQALLTEYANVFEQPAEPISRLVDHRIDLVDRNVMPSKPWLYRTSEDEVKVVQDTTDDYLARSWIGPNPSSYGAPIIVIRKNTGKLHIVIDYWLLNRQTILDSYPIPPIDELLDYLAYTKYFTKIDLVSGYHQTNMADGHEDKTAFFTRYRTYK